MHEQFGYAYDAAWNLRWRTNNALIQTFNVNSLNELTTGTRNTTNALTVAGAMSSGAASVMVNGQSAALYNDFTFAKEGFTITNGNNTFTAIAQDSAGRSDTNTVTVTLAATNTFAYDLNGNLLTNGTEVLVYDDENELITNYVAGSWKSEFVYDGAHRRRIQRDFAWSGTWVKTNETRFVYDGNVIVQHRDGNNLPTLTLTRGRDLSGSFQGAGGIGGLLAMTESSGADSFYHADGNGNVTCLLNTNQLIVAKAQYDPFGNFLSLSGPKAPVNAYWFSSKPVHWLSGKYDFLYRWYAPALQRFLNQDPIQEQGGINLHQFVVNSPLRYVDLFGLRTLVLNFGFDNSVGVTEEAGGQTMKDIESSIKYLEGVLKRCCEKFPRYCGIDVKPHFDYGTGPYDAGNKPAPRDGYEYFDRGLYRENLGKIKAKEGGVKILISNKPIKYGRKPALGWAEDGGILLDVSAPQYGGAGVGGLTHELGHHCGYLCGDYVNPLSGQLDPGHSTDPKHPMYWAPSRGNEPDECYCKALYNTAK